jgi:murein DD-endopeptidase MepM/ murein hydrolase activator NlpD
MHGDGWLATTACCEPNLHRSLRLAVNGTGIETGEAFAVDWGLVKDGSLYSGDGTQNEDHYAYGADVLAVHDGKVVFVQDGKPEQTPYQSTPAQEITDFGGNKVILEIGAGVYAAYEHLATGTVAVRVGDTVKAGDVVAKLGNTGPSEGAHLHFGLLDTPNVVTGRSLPFVIDRYTLAGTVDFATSEADHLVITPGSKKVRNAYPLYGGIQNFP